MNVIQNQSHEEMNLPALLIVATIGGLLWAFFIGTYLLMTVMAALRG
jgi:hypothetical protein